MSEILQLALIGGFVSLVSTSVGSLLISILRNQGSSNQFRLGLDFALGLMLSAVAFSLVGPELFAAAKSFDRLIVVVASVATGMGFVYFFHSWIEKNERLAHLPTTKLVLAAALIVHNFPEGMGAGASLAGMDFTHALPIQVAIASQNIAEGFILSIAFLAMGASVKMAILGGVFSGLVEFSGAAVAGVSLSASLTTLPIFLAIAGGAMLMSVGLELISAFKEGRRLSYQQLALGLLLIPVMNYTLGA